MKWDAGWMRSAAAGLCEHMPPASGRAWVSKRAGLCGVAGLRFHRGSCKRLPTPRHQTASPPGALALSPMAHGSQAMPDRRAHAWTVVDDTTQATTQS
jgi:hypothetical protein